MHYQGNALPPHNGWKKIAGIVLISIGVIIILLLMGVWVDSVYAHGDGKCEDGHKISHSMPGWWTHQADWDRVHRHWIKRPSDLDYVQTFGFGVDAQQRFDDCTPTSTAASGDHHAQESTENVEEPVTTELPEVETRTGKHTWNFDTDHYIGFPVIPDGVETVGDMCERFGMTHVWGYDEHNDSDNRFGAWNLNPDDVEITPHLGLSVSLKSGKVDIEGVQQYGEIVDLEIPDGQSRASFLIGFPEVPAKYRSLTDLMRVDGVVSITRKVKMDGKTKHIADNAEIVPGMAIMVRVRNDVTLDLRGEGVPAAPSVYRNLTTTWGAEKRR